MTTAAAHPPNTFCWIELGTSDAAGAKAFYTKLFGWDFHDSPMGPSEVYTIFKKNGADCAAMYQIGPDIAGMPPNWLSYVSVTDTDASTEQAKSLGATVVNGPFDVNDSGRMCVLEDPQGAAIAIWQAKAHIGLGVRDEPGALCWDELQARDMAAAKTFYTSMFGWTLKESEEYTELSAGDQPIGGMMPSQAPPHVPSYWLAYFAVDDCEGTAQLAQSIGGNIRLAPMDVPNVGKFSVITDPQGAVFAIIQLNF